MTTDATGLVRRYYDALDGHDYETLADVLDAEFVQRRPDRTFESRAAFVRFMRDERPNPDTRHELDAIVAADGRVAVRGRVIEESATDGDRERRALFEFADFFELEGDRIGRLETYSR